MMRTTSMHCSRAMSAALAFGVAVFAGHGTSWAGPNVCGDDKAKHGEACDGTDLDRKDCVDFGFLGGVLACNSSCDGFDVSACSNCGDGIRQSPEQCDQNDLAGKTCADLGFTGGTLACHPLCSFDTSGCSNSSLPPPPPLPPPSSNPPVTSDSWPPDELDIYRVEGTSAANAPRVTILIDNSSSMHSNAASFFDCPWFEANHGDGSKRLDWVQAVLIGCESSDDGLLDIMRNEVVFSIREQRPLSAEPLAEFGSSLSTLEHGVTSVGNTSNPEITEAIEKAGRHFDTYFNSANAGCGEHYIIDIGRGHLGGGDAFFQSACNGDTLMVRKQEPELGAEYLHEHDVICDVPGDQTVTTYSVGLEPNSPGRASMQAIANLGGGQYFEAYDVISVREALVSILSLIASRSFATSASYTVQRTPELFTGNIAYTDAYSPQGSGQWFGNVKRSCLFPEYERGVYDTGNDKCLFRSHDGENLVTNPEAVDQWTGAVGPDATTGGAGQLLRDRLADPGQSTPKVPYRPRNIVTWWPHGGYKPVTDTWWWDVDFWVVQERMSAFKNRLHGYTFAADAVTGDPLEVPEWVLGETIHPEVHLLKYAPDCDSAGECFLVMLANDGMIHFLDAATGQETQALVPFELLGPLGGKTKNELADIEDQPSADGIHRYFIDGGIRVFHVDEDGDGTIDAREVAYLIVGLGRGGNGYYKIPITGFRGVLDDTMPISPLFQDSANAFRELQETWAAPWLGRAKLGGTERNLAIFPTGHVSQFDRPDAPVPDLIPGPTEYWGVVDSCENVATMSGLNPNVCNQWYAGGYPDIGIPMGVGPFKNPNEKVIAWQFRFSRFDIDLNDTVSVEDSKGWRANAVTGDGSIATESWSWSLSGGWSSWVFDESSYISWSMDGDVTGDEGFVLSDIYRIEERAGAAGPHHPGIFVVDLDVWSGAGDEFGSGSTGTSGLLVQIAKQCGPGAAKCIDESSSPDLRYMTCPISTSISVHQRGPTIRGVYFGDECGQLWRVAPDPVDGELKANRLLNLNNADFSSQGAPVGASKDIRKVFRKLDLVLSTCSGENVVAVHFGTGNVQRPNARDELENGAITSGRDVVGVFWDNGRTSNATIGDLADITTDPKVDPKAARLDGKVGWYFELAEDEKMLRDPLVFLGTAFYKTHSPTAQARACGNTVGTDFIYAVNNCTGEAVVDADGNGTKDPSDRRAWNGNQDIGGDMLLFTPRSGKSFVSAGSQTIEEAAAIEKKSTPNVRLYQWRMPRGYE